MIKIYKNDNDELECHVKYAGFDFKFQCIKDCYGATYEGSNSEEYRLFERNIDTNNEILNNLQDVMYDIVSVNNWSEEFLEKQDDMDRNVMVTPEYFNQIERKAKTFEVILQAIEFHNILHDSESFKEEDE